MFRIKKNAVIILVLVAIITMSSVTFAAGVGEQLKSPESGWKRYNEDDVNIEYIGEFTEYVDRSLHGGKALYSTSSMIGEKIRFNFTGNKLRIIGYTSNSIYSANVQIEIDGVIVNNYPIDTGVIKFQIINFEALNLSEGEHSVVISTLDEKRVPLDAIDISEDEELKPYLEIINGTEIPSNLTAELSNDDVLLKWEGITDENAKYIIYRTTTSGGTYVKVAENITSNTYLDDSVSKDETYYYVVSAMVDDLESDKSPEVSINVPADKPDPEPTPDEDDGNILLRVFLQGNHIREYEMDSDDLDDFLDWYEDASEGKDDPYYILKKSHALGPFDSVKEYIIYDKIIFFEVSKY